ncbi:hypothetical protein CALCODRAFT_124246 [Calocera cornea HHB12733]|uniref:Telomere length regulation protein conserved domain-containing protein n=1 Tax=Calocera cornea HHB12733 TaxID=1353952 RepID=A0A165CXA8_9BASI|nr:hypothetical protein CALCODRAFT_124246 [Calocera cornea HHB12733]
MLSTISSSGIYTQLRQTREQLAAPIPDVDTLLRLLCLPLDLLGLLDTSLQRYGSSTQAPPQVRMVILVKWIPSLQSTILEHILVDWKDALVQEGCLEATIAQYFVPRTASSPEHALAALSAYDVLLNAISRHGTSKEYRIFPETTLQFILDTLCRLSEQYSVDSLQRGVFEGGLDEDTQDLLWNDCVKNIVGAPTKIANYCGERGQRVPDPLLPVNYFGALSRGTEALLHRVSTMTRPQKEMTLQIESLSLLLQKLLRVGLFPAECRSQPYAFFSSNFQTMEDRLLVPADSVTGASASSYSFIWQRVLGALTAMDAQQVLRSCLSCLTVPSSLSSSLSVRQAIKKAAFLLYRIFGKLSRQAESDRDRWESVIGMTVSSTRSDWNIGIARVIVCWASGLMNSNTVDLESIEALARAVLQIWSDPVFIKHSTRSKHQYMTVMLLLAITYLPPQSDELVSLSRNLSFLQSITAYMEHPDPSIRRLGLLAAEVLSTATAVEGKTLSFGAEMWEGEGEGKEFCRELRNLIKERDGDGDLVFEEAQSTLVEESATPEVISTSHESTSSIHQSSWNESYDSDDDSLAGYESPQDYSRSPSPTKEELEEIEKDPTLNNPKKKKVPVPVYLTDLGKLLHDSKEAEKVQVALSSAVALITRKKNYGTELDENAVDLTHATIGLQDDFSLPDFEQNRQEMLIALVACCPRKAAPTIIEQFFNHQYSVAQRSAMLTALARGARQLAALETPASQQAAFPSKQLPPAKHAKLIAMEDQTPIQKTIEGITRLVIDKQASTAESHVPAIARERHLRIHKTSRPVTDVHTPIARASSTTFKDVAAEFFIMPFVNRFWLYLRDEQTREQRTAYAANRYRGAGTGMVLSPLMLGQILATLGVLMDAARFSPAYLAILAPEVLELAVTVGSRALTTAAQSDSQNKQRADVVAYSAQVALIIIDTSAELDGGRTLAMEHARALFAVGDWARTLFENEEKGIRLDGAGSVGGSNLERVAASLVLKVHDLLDKWRGSMISGM